jgi:hypothetical protein
MNHYPISPIHMGLPSLLKGIPVSTTTGLCPYTYRSAVDHIPSPDSIPEFVTSYFAVTYRVVPVNNERRDIRRFVNGHVTPIPLGEAKVGPALLYCHERLLLTGNPESQHLSP